MPLRQPRRVATKRRKQRPKAKAPPLIRLPADVLADLARSGLTAVDARVLRISALSPAQAKVLTKLGSRSAYKLPYFDLDGTPSTFLRVRFLGEASPVEQRDGKSLRYWQPPKSSPHLYFPPYIKWRAVLADPTETIYVVEGEKKAALGTKLLQRPVVGLGGIWSWGSRKAGISVVPDLVPFLAAGRKVVLVFDAEPVENADVTAAREHLANAVWQRGATPLILTLPLVDDAKTGLDDFLLARGTEAFNAIVPLQTEYSQALLNLNSELCYIESHHAIYHPRTGTLFARTQQLTQLAYAHRKILSFDRAGNPVEKNLVAEWLGWAGRRSHSALAYDPGVGPITEKNELNVWPGWPLEPKRGPVTLFLELVDRFFEGVRAEERAWFLRWLAYPLQRPGTKLATATVLFSRDHGTGKTLLGQTMGRIYGQNYVVLNAEALHSPFNTWARHRQFVLGEELTGSERRADAERLKLLVTQERVTINAKFQPAYELPDRCNYLLTTNHADALNLDVYDRRFFVHEVVADKLPTSFFRSYDKWYRSDAGAAALFAYLLDLDVKGFEPLGAALLTRAKGEMQQLSDLPVDYLIKELLDAPERFLSLAGKPVERDLFTPRELVTLIDPDGRRKFSEQAVAKALRRVGIRQLDVTRTKSGAVRLYALRNQERWVSAPHVARAKHYDGEETKR